MQRLQPTREENVLTRLFFRFFLLYFGVWLLMILLCRQGNLAFSVDNFGFAAFLFIPLSLLGGVLTLSKPYLLVLTVIKASFDTAFLLQICEMLKNTAGGFWGFNAHLLYLAFSLLLFCFAASDACLFSFNSERRDTKLLFSLHFFKFFSRAVLFTSLALLLYFLFPHLKALL